MELWQLRTFNEIAEISNFTKASEKLNLTQSAVSHQIKALERELGVKLFIRAKRGVVLTEDGKTALKHARMILTQADEMMEDLAGRERKLAGTVRVAAATQALVHLFAPLFEDFMDMHEDVELVFRTTTTTEQTVQNILDGVADIGFASLAVYSPLVQVSELFSDELVLVVGQRHRLAKRKKVSVEDIQNEKWILFERGASIRRATDDFFKGLGVKPAKALESNDTYFVKLMIERGFGISLLPQWSVREEVRSGRLSLARVDGHRLQRTVAMISLKGAASASIRAFVAYMLERRRDLGISARALDSQPSRRG